MAEANGRSDKQIIRDLVETVHGHKVMLEASHRQFLQTQQLIEELRVKEEEQHKRSVQCKQQDELNEMLKKLEGENKELEIAVQEQKKKLQKHQLEIQKQHFKELWEIEKIAQLESEQESLQETINALSINERTANDELEDARKVAIEVLHANGADDKIGNKLRGSIKEGPWVPACKKKFKYHPDGYEMEKARLIALWEARIADHDYRPFMMVNRGSNKWEEDKYLKELKEDLEAEVMQTVVTALEEIKEYNASGRYPVQVAWDFERKQSVLLNDLLLYLKGLFDSVANEVSVKKRSRAK